LLGGFKMITLSSYPPEPDLEDLLFCCTSSRLSPCCVRRCFPSWWRWKQGLGQWSGFRYQKSWNFSVCDEKRLGWAGIFLSSSETWGRRGSMRGWVVTRSR